MDGARSASHPGGHKDLNGNYSSRSVVAVRPGDGLNKSSMNVTNENRAPLPISMGLNSMLKKTTETGDIGLFAIKPSRVPPLRKHAGTQNEFALQRPQQISQQTNGQHIVDDRKRLPSYTRDAASEIVSLYETASQKASNCARGFDAPDHRSYSITQTSLSSNALSNHGSYASLRSQPELALLPRPQSPFMYPAHLKRLGFRPSSPILPEGGRTDGGPNTELERTPYATGIGTRSASPLNVYKTSFPSVQWETNKANSSITGRYVSGSQPNLPSRKLTNDSLQDWSLNPEPGLGKALLAGGDSSTSTPIRYHRRSPTSFTATTTKSHTPSPLYFDYTEDFNIEAVSGGEDTAADSPPATPFDIDRTIYEGREIRSEASPPYKTASQGSTTSLDFQAPVTISNGDSLESLVDKHKLNSEDGQAERSTNVTQDIIPLYLDRQSYDRILTGSIDDKGSSTSLKPGGDLNDDLRSQGDGSNSFAPNRLAVFDHTHLDPPRISSGTDNKDGSGPENQTERMSIRASSLRLSTYLPIFPKPPNRTIHTITDTASQQYDPTSVQARDYPFIPPKELMEHEYQLAISHIPAPAPTRYEHNLPTTTIQRSATTRVRRIRSSRFYSIDHGLTDLAQLISNFEVANGSFTSQNVYSHSTEVTTHLSVQPLGAIQTPRTPKDSLILPLEALLQSTSLVESRTPLNKFRSEGDLRASSSRGFESTYRALHGEPISSDNLGTERGNTVSDMYNSNHPNPRKTVPRLAPHLLAPEPVSPAQVLRLKNSVPQLMKALPSVPRDPLRAILSQQSQPPDLPSTSSSLNGKQRETTTSIEIFQREAPVVKSLSTQQGLEETTELEEETLVPPPKFRIKSRFFDSQRSHSPANSRPWNIDENYPWYGQQTIRLSSLRSMMSGTQEEPKFKLRVTRASNSPPGTIRINPRARSNLDLRSPKDLFTSSSNLSEIFRQVGRQFSSRKSSAALEPAHSKGTQASFTVLASAQTSGGHGHNPGLLVPPLSATAVYPTSPTEVRSFFSEDSSQIQGHNSLRKRISNLRARIPNRYASRPPIQSSWNPAWRERPISPAPTRDRLRANSNSEQEDEYGMPIAAFRHHTLKSKVSGWFKDAGIAMRRRVKMRNADEARCMTSYR